ncbi:hypothetical protein VNO77_09059 [Canavalia gladiata]|uniref:Glycosyl hydrolase family 32 N-terminal domain-containing protein n=1 Tax=Canavalia gladiata TaxID=3824 RepID=A0AAN9M8W6_CANGL
MYRELGYYWLHLAIFYGILYAYKTFYDQSKDRRVFWGWIGESHSKYANITKGWASVQCVSEEIKRILDNLEAATNNDDDSGGDGANDDFKRSENGQLEYVGLRLIF